jgi:hypothetical protein
MLDSPVGWGVSKVYPGIDGHLVDNTPVEIELAVLEIMSLVDLTTSQKCIDLSDNQNSFNNLRRQYGDTGQMTIAESFIIKHLELL